MKSPEMKKTDIDVTQALRMRNDQVLCKRAEVVMVTEGGIAFPTEGDRKTQPLGLVIQVGPGRQLPNGGYEAVRGADAEIVIGDDLTSPVVEEVYVKKDDVVHAGMPLIKLSTATGPVLISSPSFGKVDQVRVGPASIPEPGAILLTIAKPLAPGDRVMYQKASGRAVDTTLLAEFFTVRDHEIIAVFEPVLWEAILQGRKQNLTEPVPVESTIITPPSSSPRIIT